MIKLIGTMVSAPTVARRGPTGYVFVNSMVYGPLSGRVFRGPDSDMTTTVCLLANDDGAWFFEMVRKAGGTIKGERYGNEGA